jgi:hypothetical protein
MKPGNFRIQVRPQMRHMSCIGVFVLGFMMTACGSPSQKTLDVMPKDTHGRSDSGDQVVRSSSDTNNSWGDAFTAPLEDLNLRRENIPAILESAITKPYDLTGLDHCDAISAEVTQLDALLGRDFDEPPPPKDTSTMTEKGSRMANKAAVGSVRNATRSLIPFRGLVRQMTGAEKHQKEVDTAIQAGKVRRAYLKGVGMNKNCAPPAAPSWFVPRTNVDTNNNRTNTTDTTPTNQKRTSRKHK